MIGFLLVILFTILNLGESIFIKTYAQKHSSGGMIMNAVIALFSALFFLVTDKDGFYAPLEMLPYALINCVLFASGFYFAFLAFKVGPFGLTRLISNFSLLFAIFYGIIFLDEPTTVFTYLGIAMILSAMVLINFGDKQSTKDTRTVSFKWLIYTLIMVFSNGFISVITRMQQIKFDNACSNEFQIIAIGGSFVLLGVIGLITDRGNLGYVLKHGVPYGLGAGILNGAKNFVMLAVYLYLPLSTVSPMKVGFGIISSFIVSILFYKEKYSLMQKLGVLLGMVAVILLAI